MISLHCESQPLISALQSHVWPCGRSFLLISWFTFMESPKGWTLLNSFFKPRVTSTSWISFVLTLMDSFRELWHNIKALLTLLQTALLPTLFSTSAWAPADPRSQYVGHNDKSSTDLSAEGMPSSSSLIKKCSGTGLTVSLSDRCKRKNFRLFSSSSALSSKQI